MSSGETDVSGTKFTDDALIDLYLKRDEHALRATAGKYGNYLRAVALNILGDADDCDECLNDAYFSAWNHIPPDRPRSFLAYLTRIVRNLALDRVKEKRRRKRIPPERLTSLEELGDALESDENVEDEVDVRLLSEFLSRFARALPEKQRLMFICRYYYYDSVDSIARMLELSSQTVYRELSVIREKLHNELKTEGLL